MRIRVEQDLVALAMDHAADDAVEPGVVSMTDARYGQTWAVESRSHMASMSPVRTNVSGPFVAAAGDDRRVERVGQRPLEQAAQARIGDPGRRVPDAPLDGLAAGGTVAPARAAPTARCPRVGHVRWAPSRSVGT